MPRTIRASKNSPAAEEDESEENHQDGVLFWVNKTGFPILSHVWDRMYDHAAKLHPGGDEVINKIKFSNTVPAVPIPKPPSSVTPTVNPLERLAQVQQYMCDLQYNHTGTQFFDIKKYRTLGGLTETAKEMIRESLPIKCLEAVVLGIHLTNGVPGLERLPLSFRSVFGNNVHRHVVLAVSWNGLYGALGMSRRDDLMYKPMAFTSMADLVIDFIESYHQYWHRINKVKLGFPVSHDPYSHEPIHWKGLAINPSKLTKAELKISIDKHMKDVRAWVRQAPSGANYAPRRPPNISYPTPTYSVSTPTSKVKNTSERAEAVSTTTTSLERSMTSISSKTGKSKTFEMRI